MERLRHVAQQIASGQTDPCTCLAELPQKGRRDGNAAADLLFSHRIRSIVQQLRGCIGPGGEGGTVVIMVPSPIICHVLCQLLCFLEPVWKKRAESGVTGKDMIRKLMQRPVHGKQACTRYIAGLMKQNELQRIARDVKELRVPVVVVHTNMNDRIPEGIFGKCTQVLCWSRCCRPTEGMLMNRSRLTYMTEDWNHNPSSSSRGVQTLQAVGATYAKPLPTRPMTLTTSTTAVQQEDPEYTTIFILLERLWLRCAPDSYTVAAFRDLVVRTEADVFLVEYKPLKGYRAMVRSLGQLASPEPRMHSEWHPVLNAAKRDAADKALEFFRELGLLNTGKEIMLSTAADAAGGVETIEQLTPLQSKLLE